jgi:hypothetical protein
MLDVVMVIMGERAKQESCSVAVDRYKLDLVGVWVSD